MQEIFQVIYSTYRRVVTQLTSWTLWIIFYKKRKDYENYENMLLSHQHRTDSFKMSKLTCDKRYPSKYYLNISEFACQLDLKKNILLSGLNNENGIQ